MYSVNFVGVKGGHGRYHSIFDMCYIRIIPPFIVAVVALPRVGFAHGA